MGWKPKAGKGGFPLAKALKRRAEIQGRRASPLISPAEASAPPGPLDLPSAVLQGTLCY